MNKSSLRFRRWVSCVAFMMLGLVTACGSSGDNGGAAPGSLSVSLTDAPACGFDQVNVTVSKVRVHQSSSADDTAAGWTDITVNPPRKINLLDFNDPTQPIHVQPLGLSPLEAGHYTQLRLVLIPNSGSSPLANSVVLSGTTARNSPRHPQRNSIRREVGSPVHGEFRATSRSAAGLRCLQINCADWKWEVQAQARDQSHSFRPERHPGLYR